MVGLPPVTHNMTCRNRLMERLKVPKSQKRLADDEKRQEEGKTKEAKAEVIGLPDPAEQELRSSMALGQPEDETVTSPKKPRKQERNPTKVKRELNHRTLCSMRSKEMQSPWLFQPEVQQRSNRSPLLLQQRELRWDQQSQVRHSVTANFGHQLYRDRRFGDKIQNKIISSHCFTLEWSRKLMIPQRQNWMRWECMMWRKFHHQDSQRSAKHSDYFLDTQLTWRQAGTWWTKLK